MESVNDFDSGLGYGSMMAVCNELPLTPFSNYLDVLNCGHVIFEGVTSRGQSCYARGVQVDELQVVVAGVKLS